MYNTYTVFLLSRFSHSQGKGRQDRRRRNGGNTDRRVDGRHVDPARHLRHRLGPEPPQKAPDHQHVHIQKTVRRGHQHEGHIHEPVAAQQQHHQQ